MLTVIQRVREAHVDIENKTVGAIKHGLLILCGFAPEDNAQTLTRMLDRCLRYRIFSDSHGKMNQSLIDVQGGLLLIPQFTLMADTDKGLRPGFSYGASPELGRQLFSQLVSLANEAYPYVASGQFGADMHVHLCNDGPATFILSF